MESHAVVSLRTWWLTNAKKKHVSKIRLHLKTSNCKTNKYIEKEINHQKNRRQICLPLQFAISFLF